MTIVLMNIAQGYMPQTVAEQRNNPSLSLEDATAQWVEKRYGGWVTEHITDKFTVENVALSSFELHFEQRTHAEQFRKDVGGVIV